MDKLDSNFYKKTLRPNRQRSYKLLAKAIAAFLEPTSVVDYGCGAGWVLFYLYRRGVIDLRGYEPNHAMESVIDQNVLDSVEFKSLADEIAPNRRFDLAVSLEVVEHIDKKYSGIAIENICRSTGQVMFSAAPPGQGGVGHVNEQPFEYWQELFGNNGFSLNKSLTDKVRGYLKKKNSIKWYSKNIRILDK